jgi:uncharacterized protein YidB (DUF937 family)
LRQLAQASGLPLDGLLAMLSKQLPGTIDRMSPNGALEDSEDGDSADPAGGNLSDQAGLGDVGR